MKKQTKISSFATFIFILGCLAASAQSWTWSDPQAVTDSLADNRNAQVVLLEFNGTSDHYVFWERSEDPGSTAIYYKLLYEPDEPESLLESPGVHFRNPRFISNFWDDDTLFYMFYESDQNGTIDIFYKVYTLLGFGEEILLAGTPEDDTHFRCDDNLGMVWQEGDKIMFAKLMTWNTPFYITDPVTIDSIGCHSPDVIQAEYITYLKYGADTSGLYYTYKWGSSWEVPVLIESPGDNLSAHFSGGTCGYDSGLGISMVVWENVNDGEHVIMAFDLWGEEFISEFTQESPFLPDIALYMIPVDILSESFMTFVNELEGNGDIMVTSEEFTGITPYLEDYLNLSNSSYIETNPGFFNGRLTEFCYADLVNIWESFRNGHWQLFYSAISLYCCGGTEETASTGIEFQVYPNPVRDDCRISYFLPEDTYVSIQLTTLDGRKVRLVENELQLRGEHSYELNLGKVFTSTSASGMFMVSLQTSEVNVTTKVLKVK